jgi:hypothetical protein
LYWPKNLTEFSFIFGLINFYAKFDYTAAQRDFSEFLAKVKDDQFPGQVVLARQLIEDCKAKAGAKLQ